MPYLQFRNLQFSKVYITQPHLFKRSARLNENLWKLPDVTARLVAQRSIQGAKR
jgi:hypothetical protein